MGPTDWIDRIDVELAENAAFRERTADWPTVRTLVDVGALPREALDYFRREAA